MNPEKARRKTTLTLTDLPNVGRAIAKILQSIGIETPQALAGADPLELYRRVTEMNEKPADPCLLDVFISIVAFMDGEEPKVWWAYTPRRKALLDKKD